MDTCLSEPLDEGKLQEVLAVARDYALSHGKYSNVSYVQLVAFSALRYWDENKEAATIKCEGHAWPYTLIS